jgi:hypothetical protein
MPPRLLERGRNKASQWTRQRARAYIMTRRQANGHNHLVTNRRDLLPDNSTHERHRLIGKTTQPRKRERCAAMTQRTKYIADKNMAGDLDGEQCWRDTIFHDRQFARPIYKKRVPPNGLRYPLVGGTRQRHFDGTNFKPRKLPENAPTPTSRVHAVLGGYGTRTHLAFGVTIDQTNYKASTMSLICLFFHR